jgi:hypothetical protein
MYRFVKNNSSLYTGVYIYVCVNICVNIMAHYDRPTRKVTGLLSDIHVIIQGGLALTTTLLLVDVYKQTMDYIVPSSWSLIAKKWCVCFVMICITIISSHVNWRQSCCCVSRKHFNQGDKRADKIQIRVYQ